MLEIYSLNTTAGAGASFPLTNTVISKGTSAILNGTNEIQLNKCGVYMISCDASSAAAVTIQLAKNGVLQPQAQSVGDTLSFVTLVQVSENNTSCPCTSPTLLTIVNPTDASETLLNLNIVVTKIC